MSRFLCFLPLLAALACSTQTAPEPAAGVPDPITPNLPTVQFVDVSATTGIDLVSRCGNTEKNYIIEEFGSGIASADYDGDGDIDVYVATAQTIDALRSGSGFKSGGLFRNRGNGTFENVTEQAGAEIRAWSTGAYFVDVDNDGHKDLFTTAWGPNSLLLNNGDGTFRDISGLSDFRADSTNSAGFGDLDGDGDLDLYVANYCDFDIHDPPFGGATVVWKGIDVLAGPQGLAGQYDRLYRNDGNGKFTDVTSEAGIDSGSERYYGLGVVMSDLDDDGDLDIYVANDSVPNYLWRNDGGMRFAEVGMIAGVAMNEDAREQAGMGTDAGDYDGDGLLDLFVTNFSHDFNCLYRNDGDLIFTDTTFEAQFKDSFTKLVWGTKFFDFDHDTRLDVFVANGHVYPEVDQNPHLNTSFKQTNALYWNLGDGTFLNVSDTSGPGMDVEESSRGLSVTDLDRDGDLDLLLSNMDAKPTVLINEGGNTDSWLMVRLIGIDSPRDGVGARLRLEAGPIKLVRDVNPFGSFQSQSSYEVHFGLGQATTVDRLVVRWSSGTVEEFSDLPVRAFLTITEGQGVTATEQPATGR